MSSAADPSSLRYAHRRQERMRGAGNHEIIQRNYKFSQRRSTSVASSSSSASTLSTPARQQQRSKNKIGTSATIASTPLGAGHAMSMSTPAMSIQSGRGDGIPSSSPNKYIDPLLLADQSHQLYLSGGGGGGGGGATIPRAPVGKTISERRQERMRGAGTFQIQANAVRFDGSPFDSASSPASTSAPRRGKTISERRQERMRGAGIHEIEAHAVRFGQNDSLMSSSPASTSVVGRGALDEYMNHLSSAATSQNRQTLPSWIEQRRMERRRGAGTHLTEKRQVAFGPSSSSRPSVASSSALYSESIAEEDEEGRKEGGGSYLAPMQSTPPDGMLSAFSPGADENELEQMGQMDVNGGTPFLESPGSVAAQRAMAKRKKKRQGSPTGATLQRRKAIKMAAHHPTGRSVIEITGDETIGGEADMTLQEQRDATFIAPKPPIWTIPKKGPSDEELAEMKVQTKQMVTLAFGKEADSMRSSVKVNDADVLWSILKRELGIASQGQPKSVQSTLDQVQSALLATLTHLSRQSAERALLISHLKQVRKHNQSTRKEVFRQRTNVLQIQRTTQVLKRQELKRVQKEEDEEKSIAFLSQLQKMSHEWC